MKTNNLTIRIINNTDFPKAYEEFLLERNMNRLKYKKMLSLATLFLNSSNENVQRLGYRIIVIYCNRTEDYRPLYDIAINSGIVPVSQFIEEKLVPEDNRNVFTEFNAAYNKNFVINNVFCTMQQKELIDFYNHNQEDSLSVVAPTSYGKTDLIMHTVKNNREKNVCVITPTKSLLAQTKARIIRANGGARYKIVTHPEMYNKNDAHILSVMTQERVLRLLKKDENFSFDYVIIDEAHGLLHDDERNTLLASVIMILSKRNPDTIFKFLTPFLCDANNIKVRYADYTLKTYQVNEYIKTENIYVAELRSNRENKLSFYDQFLNKFYDVKNLQRIDELRFVHEYAGKKNIVYFNKPKDIEEFVANIISGYRTKQSAKLQKACENIAEYVHPKYRLLDAIKRGVIYHHGDVPEPVRMYIEKLYAECDEIKYVVTSSTLLEGVNLPADKMFILDNKKGQGNLTPSDFKNLIGRVCRFSQIFDSRDGSLKRLEPEIYLVVGKNYSTNANVTKFIQSAMYVEKKVEDELKNVLLDKTNITPDNNDEFVRANEFIENYEGGIVPEYNVRKVQTDAGKICFINNITEIDIFTNESSIEAAASNMKQKGILIDNTELLFEAIHKMFIRKSEQESMKRFDHEETRNFYKMFLDWRITNTSLNQMISSFMKYWKGLLADPKRDKTIFVGRWGDITRNGVRPLWTDISNKSDEELINLAIVRIKEEQDFLDNVLIKYVEVLNDLELLEEKLYLMIKYGTDDPKIITCTRNGISLSLAKLLVEKYTGFIHVDTDNDTLSFGENIIEKMQEAGENEVMITELGFYL